MTGDVRRNNIRSLCNLLAFPTLQPNNPTMNSNDPKQNVPWLAQELTSEQEFYWTRFSSFATLQAGLLVLTTSTAIKSIKWLAVISLVLAVVWLFVQCASRWYVNRLKPIFRKACKDNGFDYPQHPLFSKSFLSPTDISLVVPFGIIVFWIIYLCTT